MSGPRHYAEQMPEPVRTCIGCREKAPASALTRVVWDASANRLVWDLRRRLPGRGAWLHRTTECLEKAARRKAYQRALRMPGVPLDPSVLTTADAVVPDAG